MLVIALSKSLGWEVLVLWAPPLDSCSLKL